MLGNQLHSETSRTVDRELGLSQIGALYRQHWRHLSWMCSRSSFIHRAPEYSIQAIRFADSPGQGGGNGHRRAAGGERVDTVYAVWLIRGGGRAILFDSGLSPRPLVQGVDRGITCLPMMPCVWRGGARSGDRHRDQPRSLGSPGGNRPFSQRRGLDSEGRIPLLHANRVAAGRRPRRHRSGRHRGARQAEHRGSGASRGRR
jgi:hypothetical protein